MSCTWIVFRHHRPPFGWLAWRPVILLGLPFANRQNHLLSDAPLDMRPANNNPCINSHIPRIIIVFNLCAILARSTRKRAINTHHARISFLIKRTYKCNSSTVFLCVKIKIDSIWLCVFSCWPKNEAWSMIEHRAWPNVCVFIFYNHAINLVNRLLTMTKYTNENAAQQQILWFS